LAPLGRLCATIRSAFPAGAIAAAQELGRTVKTVATRDGECWRQRWIARLAFANDGPLHVDISSMRILADRGEDGPGRLAVARQALRASPEAAPLTWGCLAIELVAAQDGMCWRQGRVAPLALSDDGQLWVYCARSAGNSCALGAIGVGPLWVHFPRNRNFFDNYGARLRTLTTLRGALPADPSSTWHRGAAEEAIIANDSVRRRQTWLALLTFRSRTLLRMCFSCFP